ncbi:MAG: hypothetical protein K8R85_17015 [Bacteroidetes bacterium]|nr:hypothetical protein [Bacteroidota bacterium]
MKKYFIIHFWLFAIFNCKSQIINNKAVDIAVGSTNFNAERIKKNKIKSISIFIVDKPDGTVIIDKGASKGYEFDENGNIKRYYFTVLNKTQTEEIELPAIKKKGRIIRPARMRTNTKYINDTVSINVFYDAKNRIITKRVKSGDYYDAYYYEYNEHGQIKKELHCKETNVSENKKEFKMGVQNILSSETFEYTVLTPTQIKKRCLNDEGREYKKAIINYDIKGNKLSETYEFMVSWMRQETTYQYDLNEKLLKRTYQSNESGEVKTFSIFEYTKNDVLITETIFKNDVLTDEINYLYDETNTLVKSEVNRDHKNASIAIVKYFYTFY